MKTQINITINAGRDVNIWIGAVPSFYTVQVTQLAPQGAESESSFMTDTPKGKAPAGKPTPAHSKPKPGGNGITSGGQGTFQAQLLNNGSPITPPLTSSWVWSDDDPNSTITTDPNDPSGGTVIITVPASDTSSQLTVTASIVDPTGATQVGSLVVPIAPGVNIFSVTVTQIA